MSNHSQLALRSPAKPVRLRVLPLLAALLVLFGSLLQASHSHEGWFAGHKTQAALAHRGDPLGPPSDESSCPICVAMHSASVGHQRSIADGHTVSSLLAVPEAMPGATRALSYSLFGRPPPLA